MPGLRICIYYRIQIQHIQKIWVWIPELDSGTKNPAFCRKLCEIVFIGVQTWIRIQQIKIWNWISTRGKFLHQKEQIQLSNTMDKEDFSVLHMQDISNTVRV